MSSPSSSSRRHATDMLKGSLSSPLGAARKGFKTLSIFGTIMPSCWLEFQEDVSRSMDARRTLNSCDTVIHSVFATKVNENVSQYHYPHNRATVLPVIPWYCPLDLGLMLLHPPQKHPSTRPWTANNFTIIVTSPFACCHCWISICLVSPLLLHSHRSCCCYCFLFVIIAISLSIPRCSFSSAACSVRNGIGYAVQTATKNVSRKFWVVW